MTMKSLFLWNPFLVGIFLSPILAEIREINLVLPPTTASIRYTDGYLRTPAWIDLSDLTFSTDGTGSYNENNNDDDNDDYDDNNNNNWRRILQEENDGQFVVDIATFAIPASCASQTNGCDWSTLGVGAKNNHGALRNCCAQDSIEWGLCTQSQQGRLIIVPNLFQGDHRSMDFPPERPVTKSWQFGRLEFGNNSTDSNDMNDGSGAYVIVFANCNEAGRPVKVSGTSIWKSVHGYLPGELFKFMRFYKVAAIIYIMLLVFYGTLMIRHKETRIDIEKYIIIAIFLGTAEMICRSIDYIQWNANGHRPMFWVYVGVLVGVLKRTAMRWLLVVLCHGWDIVRERSHWCARCTLIVVCAIYAALSAIRNMMLIYFVEEYDTLDRDEGMVTTMIDVTWLLTGLVGLLDFVFFVWITCALCSTLCYINRVTPARNRRRYWVFTAVLLCAFIIDLTLGRSGFLLNHKQGLTKENAEWLVDAGYVANYLMILISVALLWRPHPSAQQYELAAIDQHVVNEDENTLELTGEGLHVVDEQEDLQNAVEDKMDTRVQID